MNDKCSGGCGCAVKIHVPEALDGLSHGPMMAFNIDTMFQLLTFEATPRSQVWLKRET